MFDKIFAKRLSLKSQDPLDEEGVSQSGSGHEASNRVAKPQNASMGACPLEDPDSGDKEPSLTLSQRLQRTRSEQQERENQHKAELKNRKTEIITKFIGEHIEPLLKEQAIAGLGKTVYEFIPSGTKQGKITHAMPEGKNVVEGFGGSKKAGPHISAFNTKEYVKVIRLVRKEYGLEFWEQPAVMKELEQTLKSRLQTNGEKLAKTKPNSAGRDWFDRSFVDGETLSPGYMGIELDFSPMYPNDRKSVKVLTLYAEIA